MRHSVQSRSAACYTLLEMRAVVPMHAVRTRSVRHWMAGFLSILTPGLGQILQGRVRRGLVLFFLPILALFIFCHSGALKQFSGAALLILLELLLWMIAVFDAVRYDGEVERTAIMWRLLWAVALELALVVLLLPPVNPLLAGNIRIFQVNGDAMTPTLKPGDWVVVSLDSWTDDPLRRGEIIAFRHHGELLARRIIGLAGDTITFQDGRVQRNGIWLNEPYADLTPVAGVDPEELLPVQVKQNELYVLGDARNRSVDSHTADYGAVHPSDVVGRADYVLWARPLDRIGHAFR